MHTSGTRVHNRDAFIAGACTHAAGCALGREFQQRRRCRCCFHRLRLSLHSWDAYGPARSESASKPAAAIDAAAWTWLPFHCCPELSLSRRGTGGTRMLPGLGALGLGAQWGPGFGNQPTGTALVSGVPGLGARGWVPGAAVAQDALGTAVQSAAAAAAVVRVAAAAVPSTAS
jgi:hypothetical protein